MNRTISLDQLVDQVMAELEKKLLGDSTESVLESRGNVPAPFTSAAAEGAGEASGSMSESIGMAVLDEAHTSVTDSYIPRAAHVPHPKWEEGMTELLYSTPARIGVWRAGTRALTKEMLKFRCDHAAAVDSIYGEVSPALLEEYGLFTVQTRYENTDTYLKRPDLGRIITEDGVKLIEKQCADRPQVQIVISDGLSANAIDANLRDVYPALLDSLDAYGLKAGTSFFVRGGRVAAMDHIGELLQPEVLVLLIGERPGLVSSNSMSAYMCYRPRKGTVESDRTVVSNIHSGGTPPVEAGAHIGTILKQILEQQASGVHMEL